MSIVYRTLTSARIFIMCEYYLNGGVCGSCCCNTRLLGLLNGPKRKEAIEYYVNQCFENKMITSLCTMSERIYFSPIFILDFMGKHTRVVCTLLYVRAHVQLRQQMSFILLSPCSPASLARICVEGIARMFRKRRSQ